MPGPPISGPGTTGLTRRGSALLVVAGLLAFAGLLFGVQELYPLAAAAAVLVLACRIWVGHQRWDLQVTRQIHPSRVPAGFEARVELTVANRGSRRCPPVLAADPFDDGKRWARFAIAPLWPLETRTAAYRLPTTARGIFRLGPLELELGDPFGLARTVHIATSTAHLTVHPHVDAISPRSLSAQSDRDALLPLPVLGRGGDEFYALREYQPGDDLRLVHWPSTARFDSLLVRQPENLWRGRVTVAVDLRAGSHDGETLEKALSAAASVAGAALRSGLGVRMVTTGGAVTVFGSTPSHGSAILDVLAAASIHSHTASLVDGLRPIQSGHPLTLITTDAASQADLSVIGRLGGAGGTTTVVLFERRRAALGPTPASHTARTPGRVVRVPPGQSFRAAWEGAQC